MILSNNSSLNDLLKLKEQTPMNESTMQTNNSYDSVGLQEVVVNDVINTFTVVDQYNPNLKSNDLSNSNQPALYRDSQPTTADEKRPYRSAKTDFRRKHREKSAKISAERAQNLRHKLKNTALILPAPCSTTDMPLRSFCKPCARV